ncbi:hypothetical protein C8J56DRAFT_901244 [Mycena floridula]|nr:hypothetical protein C8J56DRAFT_901244 [Mycena floridula]
MMNDKFYLNGASVPAQISSDSSCSNLGSSMASRCSSVHRLGPVAATEAVQERIGTSGIWRESVGSGLDLWKQSRLGASAVSSGNCQWNETGVTLCINEEGKLTVITAGRVFEVFHKETLRAQQRKCAGVHKDSRKIDICANASRVGFTAREMEPMEVDHEDVEMEDGELAVAIHSLHNRPAPPSSPHQMSDAPASQSGAPGASETAHDALPEKDKDNNDNDNDNDIFDYRQLHVVTVLYHPRPCPFNTRATAHRFSKALQVIKSYMDQPTRAGHVQSVLITKASWEWVSGNLSGNIVFQKRDQTLLKFNIAVYDDPLLDFIRVKTAVEPNQHVAMEDLKKDGFLVVVAVGKLSRYNGLGRVSAFGTSAPHSFHHQAAEVLVNKSRSIIRRLSSVLIKTLLLFSLLNVAQARHETGVGFLENKKDGKTTTGKLASVPNGSSSSQPSPSTQSSTVSSKSTLASSTRRFLTTLGHTTLLTLLVGGGWFIWTTQQDKHPGKTHRSGGVSWEVVEGDCKEGLGTRTTSGNNLGHQWILVVKLKVNGQFWVPIVVQMRSGLSLTYHETMMQVDVETTVFFRPQVHQSRGNLQTFKKRGNPENVTLVQSNHERSRLNLDIDWERMMETLVPCESDALVSASARAASWASGRLWHSSLIDQNDVENPGIPGTLLSWIILFSLYWGSIITGISRSLQRNYSSKMSSNKSANPKACHIQNYSTFGMAEGVNCGAYPLFRLAMPSI